MLVRLEKPFSFPILLKFRTIFANLLSQLKGDNLNHDIRRRKLSIVSDLVLFVL